MEKKDYSLNVYNNNNNQYEHGNGLVISRDIIPYGSPIENCKDIVFNLLFATFKHELRWRRIIISYHMGKIPFNGVDNLKIFLRSTKEELSHRIFYATCELNHPF